MAIPFNAGEILRMAERIEENGARFYRKAAENADASTRGMLLSLARDEDKHLDTFVAMRRELSESEAVSLTFDPEGEAVRYLQCIADGHVFDVSDPSEKLTGRESVEDVLKMALETEKDSIVFYLGLRDVVPEALGSERVDAIIAEEMRHVTDLSEKLGAISP